MRVLSDFRVAANGNTRLLLQQCKSGDPARLGRAVQRMIDIENYRMMALIGLQKSSEMSPQLFGRGRVIKGTIDEQNQQLLQSVDQRASLQNRLQLTIEWFSVFAITVYLLQLAKFVLDGANGYGYRFNTPLDLGILTPIVLLLVALTINSIRRRYAD